VGGGLENLLKAEPVELIDRVAFAPDCFQVFYTRFKAGTPP